MKEEKLSSFLGSKPVMKNKTEDQLYKDIVPSKDVSIAVLTYQITAATNDVKKAALEQQLLEELQVMERSKIIIVTA